MTELTETLPATAAAERVGAHLKARYAAETRFRLYGIVAIVVALSFLAILLFTIISRGYSAFAQTQVEVPITFDAALLNPDGKADVQEALKDADYGAVIRQSLLAKFPDFAGQRQATREVTRIVSTGATDQLRSMVMSNPSLIGQTKEIWLPVEAPVDQLMKGATGRTADQGGNFGAYELTAIDQLKAEGRLHQRFNHWLFTQGDSRQPELAGLRGAIAGSFFTLFVTVLLSFPLGVAAAVYLEEFAPKNKWTDVIEVNINNLAAVPSIVFGLLALEIFLNVFGLPRSSPLVGGLALTLVSLPTIIIAGRVALKAVPPWIREAAFGLGASPLQTVIHHVLPLAMPGILTGTIIGMARAVGESAPLLMIGMVAFIVDVPGSPLEPSTVLPVQVYLWATSPERAFVERTSAAIIVLLVFLAVMNAAAIYLRKKFERRW
jgi:phosphate transport system permease protein